MIAGRPFYIEDIFTMCQNFMRAFALVAVLLSACASTPGSSNNLSSTDRTVVSLIHLGDIHGHMVPRPNTRSDGVANTTVGGLASMYTRVSEIRAANPNHLLINTGDTIQGSAEALFTNGQALVNVLNLFKIDAFAPGNWEFVYGTERFLKLFAGEKPLAPWGAVAANVFYDGAPYAERKGQLVLPPYLIKNVGGVKVGILGMTTDRGPQIVGRSVTQGFRFLKNARQADQTTSDMDEAITRHVKHLREVEKVQLLVLASELGLPSNIRIAETIAGIDVVLSSDSHEQVTAPIVTKTGTLLIEQGQDGTMLGQVDVVLVQGKVVDKKFISHAITNSVAENPMIAAAISRQRAPFVAGPAFNPQQKNPFSGALLKQPIDTVVGKTAGALNMGNFANEAMPSVVERSGHSLLTDAFKAAMQTDVGAIRGFRYGTHVAPGPIKYEDLFHFMAIGPQIAMGKVKGQTIKSQIEAAADGVFNPDVTQWTGGWMFNFSGLTMDLDVYKPRGQRASNIQINGQPLDVNRDYSYASYWYATEPGLVNGLPASEIKVLTAPDGAVMDGTEVVARYLQTLPNATVPVLGSRIRLLQPLPTARFGFKELQPVRGAAP